VILRWAERGTAHSNLLPLLWEKVAAKQPDEGS
jgi:hypothetical protein